MAHPTPLLTRPAAVAGLFYPGSPHELANLIDADLRAAAPAAIASTHATGPTGNAEVEVEVGAGAGAEVEVGAGTDSTAPPTGPSEDAGVGPGADPTTQPKALIVPHAGYVFSGRVAATAYARLLPWRDSIRRVVLLGPAHRVAVASMALSSAAAWASPLGAVTIDAVARDRVATMPGVVFDDRAHGPEHSLEVHLPFLQRVLAPGFTLLPIIVGPAAPDAVADVLDAVWGGPETLIVVSSDLSHYHSYAVARALDQATAAAIVDRRADGLDPYAACGAHPVRGLLEAAHRHDLQVELTDLRNSGDTAGDKDRVVGYGSFVLTRRPA